MFKNHPKCLIWTFRLDWETQNWQLESLSMTIIENCYSEYQVGKNSFDKMTPTLKLRFYCQEISLWFFIHMTVWPLMLLHLHFPAATIIIISENFLKGMGMMHSFQLLLSLLDWCTSITQTLLVSRSTVHTVLKLQF